MASELNLSQSPVLKCIYIGTGTLFIYRLSIAAFVKSKQKPYDPQSLKYFLLSIPFRTDLLAAGLLAYCDYVFIVCLPLLEYQHLESRGCVYSIMKDLRHSEGCLSLLHK